MGTKISPLQMTEGTAWSGYTSSNHLGAIFNDRPQVASKLVTRIKQANFGLDLDTFLGQFDPLYLDNDSDYEWSLQGSGRKNVPLVEARINGVAITAGDEAGKGHTEFELVFPDQWFSDVNVVVGEKNEKYQCQIVDNPLPEGTNWVYRVVLLTGDDDLFMPYDELLSGKRFSKDWSPVEKELSRKGGLVNFTSPFKMRNAFTMVRQQHTAAGNMIGKLIGTGWNDDNGKTHHTWTSVEDWEMERQFQIEKNRLMLYSKSNRSDDGTYANTGKSGNKLEQGAGLRQQMESANTLAYNDFSIDWLNDVLLQLSVNKLNGDEREFVILTGEYGAVQFHKAIENYSLMYTPNLTDTRFTKVAKSGVVQGLGYGGQFVSYNGPQGIVVNIVTNSLYDDPERNKVYMPGSKGLAESFRYDIMDVGTSNGEPNIRKVYVKGQEDIMGYEPGLRDPFSPTGERMKFMAHATDGYTVHRASLCGVMVKDPSKTATLLPTILA